MEALVLIGGEGTRLRPLTYHVPKALVPIVNVPFLGRMLDYLEENGVEHMVLTLCYMCDAFKDYFAKHPISAKVDFVVEEKPLGTGGAIKNAESLLGERFLVFNGDILTTIDLRNLVRFHEERKAIATIALTWVDNPSIYGIVETEPDGRIRRFVEKPSPEEVTTNFINAGIYVYEKAVLDYIPSSVEYSVERRLYPTLLEEGAPLYALGFSDYWIDIGSIEKYLLVNRDLLAGRLSLPIPGRQSGEGIWCGDNCEISNEAVLVPPVALGDGCIVEAKALVGPSAVLGDGVRVESGAVVRDCVVWFGARIGLGAHVEGCIIGSECIVESNARPECGRAYENGAVILTTDDTDSHRFSS